MNYIAATSAVLVGSLSAIAFSADPPEPPDVYVSIQISPSTSTYFSNPEKAAYPLYEAVMQIFEAKIHATTCAASAGSFSVNVYANGLIASDPGQRNSVTVTSSGAEFTLASMIKTKADISGQIVQIEQVGVGQLSGSPVVSFTGVATYNKISNLLVQQGDVSIIGSDGLPDSYQSRVIKDFYRGQDDDAPIIYDWGKQSLSKLGYPVDEYWQRSKSRRGDGDLGRTVMVKDRLIGSAPCRIMIDTKGTNREELFWQEGTLVISTLTPGEPFYDFDSL